MDSRTGLPVIGMVGGGQLARMTHQAAIALGQSLRILAAAPDDGAALVAPDVRFGDHTDISTLREFAKGCDVVTFDHEHVPTEHIRTLAAEGVRLLPGADALLYAQDKHAMRQRLGELEVPMPLWRPVNDLADIVAQAGQTGWPVVAKAVRGGYDGRGVWMMSPWDPLPATPVIVEERVALQRELAAVVARSPFGQIAAYPVVETVQRNGVCTEVIAPAPGLPEEVALYAQQMAIGIANELGVVGLLAVELFETEDELLVNELAMRPHNSAHWTIEGSRTSQFEQHLRGVLDYPLGDTSMTAPVVVMANILAGKSGSDDGGMALDERLHHLFAADPAARVHLYGKQPRPGRKIGHVTVLGDDLDDVRERAARAVRWLREGHS